MCRVVVVVVVISIRRTSPFVPSRDDVLRVSKRRRVSKRNGTLLRNVRRAFWYGPDERNPRTRGSIRATGCGTPRTIQRERPSIVIVPSRRASARKPFVTSAFRFCTR